MSFTARYHSTCPACGEHISPNDTAQWVDDEVVHVLCADPDRPTPPPAPVCTKCWVTTPCFCDPEEPQP